jgi:hyperosmotically inducible protein
MGSLIRLFIVVVLLAAIAAYFMGYRVRNGQVVGPDGTVATSGQLPEVDTTKAREAGAAIGDKVAVGASTAQHAINNAALTGKIKAKMTLDDTLKGSSISVETLDGAVTLSGTVISPAQHTRALQLARETDGVKSLTDQLKVR